ncbi:MAG: hypothetical protein AAGI38_12990 [Bacteroidota bacterium]
MVYKRQVILLTTLKEVLRVLTVTGVLSCFFLSPTRAQVSLSDSAIALTMLNVSFRSQIPGGDFADRFGFTSTLGAEVGYKFSNNFYVIGGGFFMLGGTVNEDSILDAVLTQNGLVIGDDGVQTGFNLRQQGFIIPISIGKIFPLGKPNPNCGIFVEVGGQFIQHKIRINVPDNDAAALSGDYLKGYDRLTNGIGARQAIGYRYFSNNGYLNFGIGLEFSQSFTQNRRTINVDTGLRDASDRVELLSGFYVNWTYLLYKKAPSQFYFN